MKKFIREIKKYYMNIFFPVLNSHYMINCFIGLKNHQNDLINNNIRYFFKYISMEANAFNELLKSIKISFIVISPTKYCFS